MENVPNPKEDLRALQTLFDHGWLQKEQYLQLRSRITTICYGPGTDFYQHEADRRQKKGVAAKIHTNKKVPRAPQVCNVCHLLRKGHSCSGTDCPSSDICGVVRLHRGEYEGSSAGDENSNAGEKRDASGFFSPPAKKQCTIPRDALHRIDNVVTLGGLTAVVGAPTAAASASVPPVVVVAHPSLRRSVSAPTAVQPEHIMSVLPLPCSPFANPSFTNHAPLTSQPFASPSPLKIDLPSGALHTSVGPGLSLMCAMDATLDAVPGVIDFDSFGLEDDVLKAACQVPAASLAVADVLPPALCCERLLELARGMFFPCTGKCGDIDIIMMSVEVCEGMLLVTLEDGSCIDAMLIHAAGGSAEAAANAKVLSDYAMLRQVHDTN